MLEQHYVDTATLQVAGTPNAYNELTYGTPTTISCRITEKPGVIYLSDEEVINYNRIISTGTVVKVNDLIDGKIVVKVSKRRSLVDNKIVGYKCLV